MINTSFKYALIVFLIIPLSLIGQDNKIDSLKSQLKNNIPDTQQVNILNDIAYLFFPNSKDSVLFYAEEAKVLAEDIQFQTGIAYAHKNLGLGYYLYADFGNVLSNWERSIELFQKVNNLALVGNLNNNIGAVYFNYGDDALALKYYLKALKIAEEIQDSSRIYAAYNNIGGLYSNKRETLNEALKYYQKALPFLSAVNDIDQEGKLYSNLGELYMSTKNYDSSLKYLNKALAFSNDDQFSPHTLNVKAKVLFAKGEEVEAIRLHKQAINTAKKAEQKTFLTETLIGLGESYLKQKRFNEAINTLKTAQEVAESISSIYHLEDTYKFLSDAFAALNNYQQAFYYEEKYAAYKDTIYNTETSNEIRNLQFSYQIEKKQDEINLLEASNEIQQLETKRQRAISWGAGIVGVLLLVLVIGIFRRYKFIQRITKVLEKEKARSDDLLLNILPEETAEELKEKGFTEPKYYESATILFTDFKGFTNISAKMTPNQLVSDLHECFKMFDIITSRYGLEKIKTIGDAYMAAGGLPKTNSIHPDNVARAALEIRNYMDEFKTERENAGRVFFEVRIGIHTGPVVAGVVGIKKFAYDIWGDTVNIAARMESTSEAGKVNISENTYQLIKDKFDCEYRGEIEAKNTGKLRMYFLNSLKEGQLEPIREEEIENSVEYVP